MFPFSGLSRFSGHFGGDGPSPLNRDTTVVLLPHLEFQPFRKLVVRNYFSSLPLRRSKKGCLVCISLTDLPVNLLQCNGGIMLRQCYRGSKAVKKRKSILTKEDEERSLCFSIMVLWAYVDIKTHHTVEKEQKINTNRSFCCLLTIFFFGEEATC